MKFNIVDTVKKTVASNCGKAMFQAKKSSPEILMGFGVLGVVTSAVWACHQTTKISSILEENKDVMDEIDAQEKKETEKYTKEDARKDRFIVTCQTGFKVVKLYSGPIIVGVVSLAMIFESHRILKKRNLALAAAYTAVDQGFKEYRKRVADRFGEEVEDQIWRGTKIEEIETVTVDEKGKEKKKKEKVEIADPGAESMYVKYFTKSNPLWKNSRDQRMLTFKMAQDLLNNILLMNGNVTLNRAYEELGFKQEQYGLVVGWVYDRYKPSGDNKIEFTVKEVHIPNEEGELELAYAIDFNVDGEIYTKMGEGVK